MSRVCVPKEVKAMQNPNVEQSLRKMMEDGRKRMESADRRREKDIQRVAEIKQRF